MAASKFGLSFEKWVSFKKDGDVTWCKHVCGFPHRRTYSPEYKSWRNAMKRTMEQDRIPVWKQSTAGKLAAIQVHGLTLRPVSQRSGLGQANNPCGECFTECHDLLPKEKAKKHQGSLRDMLRATVAAVLVADPTPARNDRNLSPSVRNKDLAYMLIQLLLGSPVRGLSVSGYMSHR